MPPALSNLVNSIEGSAIRRIGHTRWLRNIAVALGNAPSDSANVQSLISRASHESELVREHVRWALERQRSDHTRGP
jgi:epoxyqueuosine reductase